MRREEFFNSMAENGIRQVNSNDEQLLQNLTNHLPVALYQYLRYPDGRAYFLYVSNAIADIFEVKPEELLKDEQVLSKKIHPDDIKQVIESIFSSVGNMEIWDCQFRVILQNNIVRWVRGVARPEKQEDGGVLSNGYLEDITDQRTANDWIRYLNSALMHISESVIITNTKGAIIYANQSVKSLHGYEPEELIGKPADMMNVNPMSEEQVTELIRALDEGRTYTGKDLSRRKDGTTFICEFSLTPIPGDGEATCIGVQRDITERTLMMDALKETNERFEQLTQHSRAVAWEITRNGDFRYVSGAVQTIFGYSPEELVSKFNAFDLMVPSEREGTRRRFETTFQEAKIFSNYKCQFYDHAGGMRYLSINGIPKFDRENRISTYRGLAIDITEKELMEQQLSNETERYKTTLLSVGEGVISTDCAGAITVMNPIAERMTGWLQKEAVGCSLTEVLTVFEEQNGRKCENPADIVMTTAAVYQPDFATYLVSRDGKEIPVEIIAAPIRNYIGETSGVVIVLKDFTEYRERQKQIEFLSFHDHLTGLYNRRYFARAMKELDIRKNLPLTVMNLDVNGLKLTNDAFGHEIGDRLLCAVADILEKACRSGDVIARIGGDEFAILLPHTDAEKAKKIKQRVLQIASRATIDNIIVSLAVGYSVKTSMQENLENAFSDADQSMYKEKFNQGKAMRNQTIDTLLKNIFAKFTQEQIHTERVSQYCFLISSALNLTEKEKAELRIAGQLHDIGKIVVPSELLNKPGRLTNEEFEAIKRHSETGYQILKSADEYITIAKYVLYHHERWDGKGYPAGLKGEEIPLQSRIISIADAYEAMTANRVYQKTKTAEEAISELKKCSGTQFDPAIVDVFIESVLKDEGVSDIR